MIEYYPIDNPSINKKERGLGFKLNEKEDLKDQTQSSKLLQKEEEKEVTLDEMYGIRRPHTRPTNNIRLNYKLRENLALKEQVIVIVDITMKDFLIREEKDSISSTKKKTQKQSKRENQGTKAKKIKKTKHIKTSNVDLLLDAVEKN